MKIKEFTINAVNYYTSSSDINEKINNIKEYIGFTLYYQIFSPSTRRLDDNEKLEFENINKLYENICKINNSLFTNKKILISSANKAFSYIIWDDINYDGYIQIMNKYKLPYINTANHNDVTILHTIYNIESDTRNMYTKLFNSLDKMNNINELNYVIDYNNTNEINNILFSYYYNKGINIYNSNDKAFTNLCYQNTKLKYDLTTKYRKYSLYQGDISSNSCKINNINEELKLDITCEDNEEINYFINKNLTNINLEDNYSNLPLKCLNKVNKLHKNAGFWIYFILIIIIIILTIILSYFENDFYSQNIIENDELKTQPKTTNTPTEKGEIQEKKILYETIYIKKSLFDCFIFNILYYHPIMRLMKTSILSPIIFNLWIFIFNISNLFGFNAILYSEKLIEKRIYNKHRDDFAYPMRKEFGKIILSILITMLFTIIMKFINLTFFEDKNILAINFSELTTRKEYGKKFTKNKLLYRIFAGIIMFIIIFIMWLYSIGFCYIYYHTQKSWVYSGIWSLFWVWIIFAPLFLFLISLYESFIGNEEVSYYMKRLFCF